jgi:ribonuclease BN (tRNA processing enzyme)
MRLTTIGTGTAAPSPHRVCAGHLVDAGGVCILMDCGSGVVHRMAALGIDWMRITHVALTHFHADHISDLATLIFAWRHGRMPARSAPAEVIGPAGTQALVAALASAFGAWLREPGFPLRVHEIAPDEERQVGGVRLAARRVRHTPESMAYSIDRGGRRIVYTGDTGFDPALAEWAAGCDVLLTECSLPAAMAMDAHLTPEECGALAERAQPRLLALTHFYPPVERVDIRAAVGERFAGPLVLAVDGWSTEIEEP